MSDVTKLATEPAINDLVVRITTAAVMCLDADEEDGVRLAAFERGIVQDIDRFRQAALATAEAEAAELRAEVERLRGQIWQAVEDEAIKLWAGEPISGSRAYYGCEWDELTDRKRNSIRLQALSSFALTRAALTGGTPHE